MKSSDQICLISWLLLPLLATSFVSTTSNRNSNPRSISPVILSVSSRSGGHHDRGGRWWDDEQRIQRLASGQGPMIRTTQDSFAFEEHQDRRAARDRWASAASGSSQLMMDGRRREQERERAGRGNMNMHPPSRLEVPSFDRRDEVLPPPPPPSFDRRDEVLPPFDRHRRDEEDRPAGIMRGNNIRSPSRLEVPPPPLHHDEDLFWDEEYADIHDEQQQERRFADDRRQDERFGADVVRDERSTRRGGMFDDRFDEGREGRKGRNGRRSTFSRIFKRRSGRDDHDPERDFGYEDYDEPMEPMDSKPRRRRGRGPTSSSRRTRSSRKQQPRNRRDNHRRGEVLRDVDFNENLGDNYDATIERLLHLTNQRRGGRHNAVRLNPELCEVAQRHAQDMADGGYFAHECKRGSTVGDRVRSLDDSTYRYRNIGENLYYLSPRNDPHRVIEGWLESREGHRENLLNPDMTDVGFGYVTLPSGYGEGEGMEQDEHFYVQILARPLDTPDVSEDETRDILVSLTNQERSQRRQGRGRGGRHGPRGRDSRHRPSPPLVVSDTLNEVAQVYAEDMARSGRTENMAPRELPDPERYGFYSLAALFSYRKPFNDPHAVVQEWVEDGKHEVHDEQFTDTGVGYANHGDRHYYVQLLGMR